jgi:RNA-directed DNA polymerase
MKEGKSFEIAPENVREAYRRVKANQGASGIDKITISEYEKNLDNNLYKLWNRMSSGTYFPQAVQGIEIPKKDGRKRLLGIPTVQDRVAQMVVRMEFEPQVEPHFSPNSYGYRPNKSALEAIGKTRERCWQIPWVLEFDIKGLFDNIDHGLMMKAVRKHTENRWVILYIERFLKAPMQMPDGTIKARNQGTPQGGVISPILSNLFMHYAFDKWMQRRYPKNLWARYADDGIVHCRKEEEAKTILEGLKERLKECKLEIHPEKTRIVYCRSDKHQGRHEHESFDFLGYTYRRRRAKGKDGRFFYSFLPAVSKASSQSLKDKLREIRRKHPRTIEELADKINPIVRGWAGYFTKYSRWEAKRIMRFYANRCIALFLKREYARTKKSMRKAFQYLNKIKRNEPNLFYHWQIGL